MNKQNNLNMLEMTNHKFKNHWYIHILCERNYLQFFVRIRLASCFPLLSSFSNLYWCIINHLQWIQPSHKFWQNQNFLFIVQEINSKQTTTHNCYASLLGQGCWQYSLHNIRLLAPCCCSSDNRYVTESCQHCSSWPGPQPSD